MNRSNLLFEKFCAFLNRKRSGDIYKLLFMLKRKIPFDGKVFDVDGIESNLRGEVILNELASLSKKRF